MDLENLIRMNDSAAERQLAELQRIRNAAKAELIATINRRILRGGTFTYQAIVRILDDELQKVID